jgi:rhodanese-related sulfurtransferase
MTDYAYETVTYTNVTGSEFEKLAKEKTDAVIIDLRDSKDFDESSIENAKHMSSDDFATEADAQLTDKNQEILLYCNTGTRTANAAKILEEKGYTNVVNSIDGVKEYNFDLKQK